MRRSEGKWERRSIERRDGVPGGAAPTPTGREASPASRWGRSQGSAKAGLANPLAPPGAPFPRLEGKGKGTGLPGALKKKSTSGIAERWLLAYLRRKTSLCYDGAN